MCSFILVPAIAPPLEVLLINGSPRVSESSVEAEFVTSRPVATARCFFRSRGQRMYKDCMLHYAQFWLFSHVLLPGSNGRVLFSDLKSDRYILKISARNKLLDAVSFKTVVNI